MHLRVEELEAVFDPRGGYLKRGGVYMPSLVVEIGLDEGPRRLLAEQWAVYQASQDAAAVEPGEGFPPGARLCGKCQTQTVVRLEGCATGLNCGYSRGG